MVFFMLVKLFKSVPIHNLLDYLNLKKKVFVAAGSFRFGGPTPVDLDDATHAGGWIMFAQRTMMTRLL